MRYVVTIDERTVQVDVLEDRVVVDDQTVDAGLEPLAGSSMSRLLMNGESTLLALLPLSTAQGGWIVEVGGRRWMGQVLDERAWRAQGQTRTTGGVQGVGLVSAPMPGLVLRLEVKEGQEVTRGTGLVVLEAMKMENEIKAPGAGIVRRVLVEAGTAVEKGTGLIEIEPGS